MNRLGLWGYGTEHPSGFSQFFKGIKRFGCGTMELHEMHLKGQGALMARTLSYSNCEFEPIVTDMDEKMANVYNGSVAIWREMFQMINENKEKNKQREVDQKNLQEMKQTKCADKDIPKYLMRIQNIEDDSDDEGGLTECEEATQNTRRKARTLSSSTFASLFWGSHQRFFCPLCIASKVDVAINVAK